MNAPHPDSACAWAPRQTDATPIQWLSFATIFGPGVYALLIVYAAMHGVRAELTGPALYITVFTAIWFTAYALRRRIPRVAGFVRFMLPVLLYGAFYSGMHAMLAATGHPLIDARLAAIDRALFGTDPIAWLGNHGHPLLTDVLFLSYFSYYFGMPILLILMWRGNSERAFRTVLSSVVMGWYGALISYAIFPALGPNRSIPELLPSLHGWLPTTAWITTFLAANLPITVRDCVPSMHTGVTLLTLVFAFQYRRRFFRSYFLPGIGLILATMYTQQHYAIDVLLGVGAFAVIYGATTTFRLQ
jgi:hypothetical protein